MRLHILLIMTFLGGVLACQQVVEEPLPLHTPRMVLHAFLEPGAPVDAYVSRSFGPLEQLSLEELMLTDATVRLSVGGQAPEPMVFRDSLFDTFGAGSQRERSGKYESARRAVVGETYTFTVAHPDYPSLEAIATVPQPPAVNRVWIERDVARPRDPLGNDQGSQSLLQVEVDDPAGLGNHYEVREMVLWAEYAPFGSGVQALSIFVEGEAVVSSEGGYQGGSRVISDATFDGQAGVLSYLIYLPNAFEDPASLDSIPLTIQSIVLETRTFGSTFAQYQEKLDVQAATQNSGFSLFPPEAVVVPSNVTGGYGIVAGTATVRDSFPQ